MELKLESIGIVKSPVIEGVDNNWGEVKSEIIVDSEFAAGLKGLEEFSHAIIVYFMHKSSFCIETDLQRRPQGRDDMPIEGIFSQRAKHRPNPIGITSVQIVSVQDNILRVKGLDAIDGTPVLDIKPYYPVYDMKQEAKTPEWVDVLMKNYF
ncbi:tRNA (N6-threonylcarbamoyladenosine(37)-N6)-methyltransferase TrmO [Acetivibrio cellulolyticus]|uniref:tRNA (N6-threonylcarbamoyladenosine(37)-N6)-methyltransferase TrmO n=1 Tax=Acetivibrio cellulolyticus TaxID=35830 RepID=UPI0001E2EB8F|nr:tRNA (N6-threonylcarbamoyladenosine(37)-N6)-methyltransferase TrmO [Acetivibrio cellulolyticus]